MVEQNKSGYLFEGAAGVIAFFAIIAIIAWEFPDFDSVFAGIMVLVCFVTIVISITTVHNALNPYYHKAEEAKAKINLVMQKRLALTIQLTDIANKYADHERDIHVQISNDKKIQDAILYVNTRASHFPSLKADLTYIRLMNEFSSIANEVHSMFQFRNDIVREINTKRSQFPINIYVDFKLVKAPHLEYLDSAKWTFVNPPTVLIKQLGSKGFKETEYEEI